MVDRSVSPIWPFSESGLSLAPDLSTKNNSKEFLVVPLERVAPPGNELDRFLVAAPAGNVPLTFPGEISWWNSLEEYAPPEFPEMVS